MSHKTYKLCPKLPPRVSHALKWITNILDKEQISYQICGGVSARFFGAKRPINDIDIDIKEADFPKLHKLIKSFVMYGPEIYRDKKWDVLMMSLVYKNQLIELTNADNAKIFDAEVSKWKIFKYNLRNVYTVSWGENQIKLMGPKNIIEYKKLL